MARGPRHIFRHCSPAILRALFDSVGAATPELSDDLRPAVKLDRAQAAANVLAGHARQAFHAACSEIEALAHDAGVDCLRDCAADRRPDFIDEFVRLTSHEERAAWAYIHHSAIFERARDRWFVEKRENSAHLSDAFQLPSGALLRPDLGPLERAIAQIFAKDMGEATRVKLEAYEFGGGATLLTVHHEGSTESATVFDNGALASDVRRVVRHLAIKIEVGVATIVSEHRSAKRRLAISSALAQHGFGLEGDLVRLPPLEYNLQRLLDPSPFETDSAHAIASAIVSSLKISAPSLSDATDTISSTGRDATDVRARVLERLSAGDRRAALVEAGELRITFEPKDGKRRKRIVRVEFAGPRSCKIRLNCAEEELVRAHYLRRWGLIARPTAHLEAVA